ncbi:inverse autotransporter beta domain-containing protein [Deltaproteobacteria bacterium OttesenSCG-928-K17]|nr:inverse autotransporter beta domain-containing protein [Deltaproteobacteria bacterium OttesenSCG-928-K17]
MSALGNRRFRAVGMLLTALFLCLISAASTVAEEPAPVFELPPARGAVDWSGVESYLAPEAAPSFQLPADQSQAVQAEAGSPVLDKALGLVGLPGMADASADDSTYEKAWRMQDGPNGGTRLTYGERYRRNPDGSYGVQSSSQWNTGDIGDRLLEQALSAGSGYFSSWAEGWLGGYGKARISLRVNDEGDVTGSGDFLYPIYDSERTTFFTQIGLRTMANDRVIGNFGLGQRFFLADNFALGYNAFIDQDFSRNHTRGGAGVEAWYDWLRLSANYYTPLSGWKDSEDYDSRFVEERPAEGYDARLTGYLPFYRNLAVTGAFEKWKGDHVGAFGDNDFLHKDPKVWSYGLEWTPVPAFSTSVNQRHSGSQKETQFAMTFNYNFGMDWEDQLSSNTVTEMRTVDGSRHDFVNRQNEMILEYRAKDNFYIEFLSRVGVNQFKFRIRNGFDQYVAGQTVRVTAGGGVFLAEVKAPAPTTFLARAGEFLGGLFSAKAAYAAERSKTYITDQNGEFIVELDTVTSLPASITAQAGKATKTVELTGATLTASNYTLTLEGGAGSDILDKDVASGLLTFTLKNNGSPVGAGVNVDLSCTPGDFSGLPGSAVTTDSSGQFTVSGLTALKDGVLTVTATLSGGETATANFRIKSLVLTAAGENVDFSTASDPKSVITVTAQIKVGNDSGQTISNGSVTWTVENLVNPTEAWWKAGAAYNGLAWGEITTANDVTTGLFSSPGTNAEQKLTDIVGNRKVTVKAVVDTLSATKEIEFGGGPLSVFADAGTGSVRYIPSPDTQLPTGGSVELAGCGTVTTGSPNYYSGSGGWISNSTSWDYSSGTWYYTTYSELPTVEQLLRVAVYNSTYNNATIRYGAAKAAGWLSGGPSWFWTGEVNGSGDHARVVYLGDGGVSNGNVHNSTPTAVCLR